MIASAAPRVEINLAKIAHNARELLHKFGSRGIGIIGVTKVVCGCPIVADILVNQGILTLADSKLENLKKMRDSGVRAQYVLLRTPSISEVDAVIRIADISMNTELSVIRKLSDTSKMYNRKHKIILMVEMGDLREGIMPADLVDFIQETLRLTGVEIVGIGANFACFGGVRPSVEAMKRLSALACDIETEFSIPLHYISGGSSANYNWFMTAEDTGKINNLRLGESIFLGREPLDRNSIPGLYTDAFMFVAEIIEAKVKPSKPYGEIGQNVFGNTPHFQDRGFMTRGLLGVGSQDVLVTGLTPHPDIAIIGSSSDHIVVDLKNTGLKTGDEVAFSLSYGALLSVMTSPYVNKAYVNSARTALAESYTE